MKKKYIKPLFEGYLILDDEELLSASPTREIDWGNKPNGEFYDPDDEQSGIDVIEDDEWEWGTI